MQTGATHSTKLSFDEGWARVAALGRPVVETELLPLHAAAGRILHGEIRSTTDLPPFDSAAMDGYGVADDLGDAAAVPASWRWLAGLPPERRRCPDCVPVRPCGCLRALLCLAAYGPWKSRRSALPTAST